MSYNSQRGVRRRPALKFVLIGFTQQLDKLLFGGESPLTMRYGLWVDNPHPLGPSTGTA